MDEVSGPRYRKIGLNGLPVSDNRPQGESESDYEPEQTYIDALTRDLHHSTTDVYVPVPASDLTLSVRRNSCSTIWSNISGATPAERPDLPFGPAWCSNLTGHVRTSLQVVSEHSQDSAVTLIAGLSVEGMEDAQVEQCYPNTATVVDEDGSTYKFLIIGHQPNITFQAVPTALNQLPAYTASLTQEEGALVLRKKYGTTVSYSGIISLSGDGGGLPTLSGATEPSSGSNNNESSDNSGRTSLNISNNRLFGSRQNTLSDYYRITSVRDRAGNQIDYSYANSGTLIPDRIIVVLSLIHI